MEKNLKVLKVANCLAITTGIIYLVCIIGVWVVPTFTLSLGSYLLHGIDISRLVTARSLNFSVISLIVGTVLGWLTGALFAVIYNKLN